jgi:hypothetical protein
VFENGVRRRIFRPKRDEVTGGWGKFHNKELHNLYSSDINRMIKSRGMRWAGHVSTMGTRNTYIILVAKPEGKRSIRRPMCRWEDNIKMDLREIVLEGMEWIHLA